jgi:hypothetical protein
MTEYALMIELVDGTSSAHSFNPYAYFGHSWSYFDIQNLQLVILLLAQGRWFSPGIPASSTTKTGRHDISEILLKVALNTINLNLI